MPIKQPIPPEHPRLNTSESVLHREAESIWHLTELLSKLGKMSGESEADGQVTLSSGALNYVAGQISGHVQVMVEVFDDGVRRCDGSR